MDAERWQEVQRIFEQAIAQPTAERAKFLAEACGEDADLRYEVTSLIQADAEAGEHLAEVVGAGEALLLEGPKGGAKEAPAPHTFGNYEVEKLIGEGGFGVVYRGRDPVLKRTVAIKACGSVDAAVRRRFFREGQIAAGLQHPNIVTVHELGVEEGVPYLVQEFLDGRDLRQLIAGDAKGELAQKLDILLQVARGLQHAHRAGVLHRDVKPANIFVLAEGGVKILDFGIAKLLDAESQLTNTGMTLGTVGYLAPEQLRSETIDQRADIFSFGVVAYELLTGERPFKGEDFSQVSYQLLYVDPQAVEKLWAQCPPALGALVRRCLEKTLEGRVRDFGVVIKELEAMLELAEAGEDLANKLPLAAVQGSGASEDMESALAEEATLLLPSPEQRHRPPLMGKNSIAVGVLLVGVVAIALLFRFGGDGPNPQPEREVPAVESSSREEPTTTLPSSNEGSESPPGEVLDEPSEESSDSSEEFKNSSKVPPPNSSTRRDPPESSHGGGKEIGLAENSTVPVPVSVPVLAVAPNNSSALEEPGTKLEALEEEQSTPPEPEPGLKPEPTNTPKVSISTSPAVDKRDEQVPTMNRGDLLTIGPGVKPPELIDRPQPDYPRRARRRNKEARVVVKVLVDEEGKVLQAIAPPDEDGFGEAARRAALGARFEPATKDGIAGKMWRNLPFEFKVE